MSMPSTNDDGVDLLAAGPADAPSTTFEVEQGESYPRGSPHRFSRGVRTSLILTSILVVLGALIFVIVVVTKPGNAKPTNHGGDSDFTPEKLSELRTRMKSQYQFVNMRTNSDFFDGGAPKEMISVVEKIVLAGHELRSIFFEQVWAGNEGIRAKLRDRVIDDKNHDDDDDNDNDDKDRLTLSRRGKHDKDEDGEAADRLEYDRLKLSFFDVNAGPWDLLNEGRRFINDIDGVPEEAPIAGSYYPADMTPDEFETWVGGLSAADAAFAKGFYSVIRRDKSGKLMAVPYSKEYSPRIENAAKFLESAADDALAVGEDSLADFLRSRANAFRTDDYRESDLLWMKLNSTIDVTIGAYETYIDGHFGLKAAFEVELGIVNQAETARWRKILQYLPDLELALPEPESWKNHNLRVSSTMVCVDEVFAAGDLVQGVQTVAYNLPNDEATVAAHGSKRVMLLNVQQSKFDTILKALASKLVDTGTAEVSFDSFLSHTVMHEAMHGLGPHQIEVNGEKTTPRAMLKDRYAAIEEAKADVLGLWSLPWLKAKGALPELDMDSAYVTYVASSLRSLRFGLQEAHGKGQALQFNFLASKGAIEVNEDGSVRPDLAKMPGAIEELAERLLEVEGKGDYDDAGRLFDIYANSIPDSVAAAIAEANKAIPVDIQPIFSQTCKFGNSNNHLDDTNCKDPFT